MEERRHASNNQRYQHLWSRNEFLSLFQTVQQKTTMSPGSSSIRGMHQDATCIPCTALRAQSRTARYRGLRPPPTTRTHQGTLGTLRKARMELLIVRLLRKSSDDWFSSTDHTDIMLGIQISNAIDSIACSIDTENRISAGDHSSSNRLRAVVLQCRVTAPAKTRSAGLYGEVKGMSEPLPHDL